MGSRERRPQIIGVKKIVREERRGKKEGPRTDPWATDMFQKPEKRWRDQKTRGPVLVSSLTHYNLEHNSVENKSLH